MNGTVVFRGADGQWYYKIVAANGQVLATSEGYTRKWSAKRAAKALRKTLQG